MDRLLHPSQAMPFLSANKKYLAIDDRFVVFLVLPILGLLVPMIFFGYDYREVPLTEGIQQYTESLTYCTVFWLFNRGLLIYLRKRYDAFDQTIKRFGLQLLLIIVFSPVISLIITLFFNQFRKVIGAVDHFEPTLVQGLASTYVLTFSVLMFYDVVYFFHKYKEAIVEKEKIQQAHIQSQLDNLRNQINPHFLFNSMNTLMNLIPLDADRAMSYLNKLAKFYRYTVSNKDAQLVLLEKELNNVRIYADLLKERFQQGIQIHFPDSVPADVKIIPLCLQLLIENAVKHNIVSSKKPLNITLKIHGDFIIVENNVQLKIEQVASTGTGLKNIKSRIAFFTKAPLRIEETNNKFVVSIPLISSKHQL